MIRQVLLCARVNLVYYRRSQVLILLAALAVLTTALPLAFSFTALTATDRLETIMLVYHTLTRLGSFLIPVMALFTASQPLSQRSVKMVLTQPCPPEAWMASHFVSLGAVTGVLYGGASLLSAALFFAWKVPFQGAIFGLALYEMSTTWMLLSALLFFTTFLHPIIAFFAAVMAQDGIFRALAQAADWSRGRVDGAMLKHFYGGLSALMKVLYIAFPTTTPYLDRLPELAFRLRLEPGQGRYVLAAAAYSLLFALFCGLASARVLRRRNLA